MFECLFYYFMISLNHSAFECHLTILIIFNFFRTGEKSWYFFLKWKNLYLYPIIFYHLSFLLLIDSLYLFLILEFFHSIIVSIIHYFFNYLLKSCHSNYHFNLSDFGNPKNISSYNINLKYTYFYIIHFK